MCWVEVSILSSTTSIASSSDEAGEPSGAAIRRVDPGPPPRRLATSPSYGNRCEPRELACWERLGRADRAESVATGRAAVGVARARRRPALDRGGPVARRREGRDHLRGDQEVARHGGRDRRRADPGPEVPGRLGPVRTSRRPRCRPTARGGRPPGDCGVGRGPITVGSSGRPPGSRTRSARSWPWRTVRRAGSELGARTRRYTDVRQTTDSYFVKLGGEPYGGSGPDNHALVGREGLGSSGPTAKAPAPAPAPRAHGARRDLGARSGGLDLLGVAATGRGVRHRQRMDRARARPASTASARTPISQPRGGTSTGSTPPPARTRR